MRPFLLFAAALAVAAEPAPKDEFKLTEKEQKLLDLTNAERKAAGAAELKPNPKLFAAARGHSENMATQLVLAHTLDDKTFDQRIKDAGYDFGAAAENIAEGQDTPEEAVRSWMNSEGHKVNLLNADFTEVGLAVRKGENGRRFWTQVFAKPRK